MRSNRKLSCLALMAGLISLSGCQNDMTLNPSRPNASNNPSRYIVQNPGNSPVGTTNTTNANFDTCQTLAYYENTGAPRTQLKNICAAHDISGSGYGTQLKLSVPGVPNGQSICVITAVKYNNYDACGRTFVTDIGEQRCGVVTGGALLLSMARSNFNYVTVLYNENLNDFVNWYNGATPSWNWPSLAQGPISADIAPPVSTTCSLY